MGALDVSVSGRVEPLAEDAKTDASSSTQGLQLAAIGHKRPVIIDSLSADGVASETILLAHLVK